MREKGMMKSEGNRKRANGDMVNRDMADGNRTIGNVAKRSMIWECGSVKRKSAMLTAILGICGCVLTGCGDGMQTEEELVIPVEQAEEDKAVPEAAGNTASAGDVAGQVQAPDRYQWEGGLDVVSVQVDAMVEIPDVAGIRTKKITGCAFVQEDYDRVDQALLGGGKLWDRDYQAMADSNGFTASELEEALRRLEAIKENGTKGNMLYGDKAETLDQQMVIYRDMLEKALEEPVLMDIPAIVNFDETLGEGAEENYLRGMVTVDGKEYRVIVDNSLLTGEIRRAVFSVGREAANGSWNWLMSDHTKRDEYPEELGVEEELAVMLEELQLQPDTAVEETRMKLKEMGMEEYAPYGGEYSYILALTEDEKDVIKQVGYQVHCSRVEDGVPVLYKHEDGSRSEEARVWWPAEEMTFVYTDEGLISFEWVNPWVPEDLSAEPVFLLPFTEIADIFQEMIIKKSLDEFSVEGDRTEIQVSGVRLGYMLQQDTGVEQMTGTLVPVWNFTGRKIGRNAAGEIKYVIENEYESLLTINAIDGTIVE